MVTLVPLIVVHLILYIDRVQLPLGTNNEKLAFNTL